jgi:hypothetical protein
MPEWLLDRQGDMVWNALILVTVLLPLAGLTIDVPRYFILRARLQAACNAASEAAARAVDVAYFQDTGDTRLVPGDALASAQSYFAAGVSSLSGGDYQPVLAGFAIDSSQRLVTVQGSGTLRLLFNTSPAFVVRASSTSWYRLDHR